MLLVRAALGGTNGDDGDGGTVEAPVPPSSIVGRICLLYAPAPGPLLFFFFFDLLACLLAADGAGAVGFRGEWW